MEILDGVPFFGFILFGISLFAKIQFLKKKGIALGSGSQKSKKWFYFLSGFLFFIWLYEIVKPLFSTSFEILPLFLIQPFVFSLWLKIFGAFLILVSLILWCITLLQFKTSLRFGLDHRNTGELITTGIFSITRNPFFLSLSIYFTGIALIIPNLFFIAFTILTVVSIHFFIIKEEKFLLKVYGKEYESYSKMVRRYF